VSEGVAAALHCLFWSAGPHAYSFRMLLCQLCSQELLRGACRNSSSSSSAALASVLSTPLHELLQSALQATPEQVREMGTLLRIAIVWRTATMESVPSSACGGSSTQQPFQQPHPQQISNAFAFALAFVAGNIHATGSW
jgi:hypothetical protein